MIRALFFDLDGTLLDRAGAHRRYCLDLIARRPDAFAAGQGGVDLDRLVAGADAPGWDRRAFARRAASAFPALGLSAAEIARDHSARLASFIEPDPAVSGLLGDLAGRYRVAIVTDGAGPVQRAKLGRLGLGAAIPRAFVSGEIGSAKPDPAPFLAALAWAGCLPSEALFVGDDPARDIAGASNVGMATCWVSAGRPYPPGFPTPGRTVQSVADLAAELAS
ncbi:HAD family hydrolase [Tundrisphaera sp. TA3]|uniref:HAD family hydrolase n=1 Tax=Tundrisphaera sp. TA3 TaxID=3435775 RepID=UPI003EB8021C